MNTQEIINKFKAVIFGVKFKEQRDLIEKPEQALKQQTDTELLDWIDENILGIHCNIRDLITKAMKEDTQ